MDMASLIGTSQEWKYDDSISYSIGQERDTPTSPVQTNSSHICQTKFDTTLMYLIAVIICQILLSKQKPIHIFLMILLPDMSNHMDLERVHQESNGGGI